MTMRNITPWIILITFGVLLWHASGKTYHSQKSRYNFLEAPVLFDVPNKILPVYILGQKSIYDDIVLVWMIQVLINPDPSNQAKIKKLVDKAIIQKPKVESLYLLSCFTFLKDFKRPEDCESVILKGLEVFPSSWRLPMTQGFIHYFELNNPAQAAAFFKIASTRQNSPEYVANIAEKILQKEDITDEDRNKGRRLIQSLINSPNQIPSVYDDSNFK